MLRFPLASMFAASSFPNPSLYASHPLSRFWTRFFPNFSSVYSSCVCKQCAPVNQANSRSAWYPFFLLCIQAFYNFSRLITDISSLSLFSNPYTLLQISYSFLEHCSFHCTFVFLTLFWGNLVTLRVSRPFLLAGY